MAKKAKQRAKRKRERFGNRQTFEKHTKSIVKDAEGVEYQGFPFAKALGEHYQSIMRGVTKGQASVILDDLNAFKNDTETHHNNLKTLNRISYISRILTSEDNIVAAKPFSALEEETQGEAEEHQLDIGDTLVVSGLESPKQRRSKNGKIPQYSFKPFPNMPYRVFIHQENYGDVTEGEKVKIISSNNDIYFTAVSIQNPPKQDQSFASLERRIDTYPIAEDFPIKEKKPFELEQLELYAEELETAVRRYDGFTSGSNTWVGEGEGKIDLGMLLWGVFSIAETAMNHSKHMSPSLKETPEGKAYLAAHVEAMDRWEKAQPIIEEYKQQEETNP